MTQCLARMKTFLSHESTHESYANLAKKCAMSYKVWFDHIKIVKSMLPLQRVVFVIVQCLDQTKTVLPHESTHENYANLAKRCALP